MKNKVCLKLFCLLLSLILVLSSLTAASLAAGASGFTDVPDDAWFAADVAFVVENGLFRGTSDDTFEPNATMNRAMFVTVLYRLAGQPEPTEGIDFTDVPTTAYYYKPVCWAKSTGVVFGLSETRFGPSDPVKREQVVSLLYRYLTNYLGQGADGAAEFTEFTDADEVSSYAVEAMAWAVGNELMRGDNGALNPSGKATRAQVAAIITRFVQLLDEINKEGLRIVCMAPSMVECVYALGYGDCIVGWSAYTDYPVAAQQTEGYQPYQFYYDTNTSDFDVDYELGLKPGADGHYKEVATVSKFYDYNHDILVGLKPTLILCEGSEQEGWVEPLTAEGYPTYCWTPESIDEIYDMMLQIGSLLGAETKAQNLVDGYYARIAEIQEITKDLVPIRTYFEIAHQSDYGEWGKYGPYTEGGNTPFDQMIQAAGGVNIFHDGEGYINLYDAYGEECFPEIVSRDPQVILSPYWPGAYDFEVTTIYEIMTRPGFSEIQAVKTGRVYFYDSSLMKRFGPRTVTAIEKLAWLLHPYYFQNPENSVSPWELGKIDVDEPFPAPLN